MKRTLALYIHFYINQPLFRMGTTSNRRIRGGAPFIAMPPFRWSRRETRGCVWYIVGTETFLVDRTVSGVRHSQNIDLLRCEEADCVVFAFKYQGYIYIYGYHNHV